MTSDAARQMARLGLWLAALYGACALFAETGGRRFCQPYGNLRSATHVLAYQNQDHSDSVVFIGDSQVGSMIVPRCVEEGLGKRGLACATYVLWLPGGIVPSHFTIMRDVVLRHGRPRLVVIQVSPRALNANNSKFRDYASYVASVGDVARLIKSRPLDRWGLATLPPQRVPAVCLQSLLGRALCDVEDVLSRSGSRWYYDPDKAAESQAANDAMVESRTSVRERAYGLYLEDYRIRHLQDFELGDMPLWLADAVDLARSEGVPVALLYDSYSDRGRQDLDGGQAENVRRALEGFAREWNVPLLVAAEINPKLGDAFCYTELLNHATPAAAYETSRLIGSGPLADCLEGSAPGGRVSLSDDL